MPSSPTKSTRNGCMEAIMLGDVRWATATEQEVWSDPVSIYDGTKQNNINIITHSNDPQSLGRHGGDYLRLFWQRHYGNGCRVFALVKRLVEARYLGRSENHFVQLAEVFWRLEKLELKTSIPNVPTLSTIIIDTSTHKSLLTHPHCHHFIQSINNLPPINPRNAKF